MTQTLANVRNAYWDLVFARNAVDVAQRALQLADKLVEDNKARVEVGTLAPLDIVQAEAEAANRRQTLARRRSDAADGGAGAQALHRQRHRGSAVAAGAAADRSAVARARADRHRRRRAHGASSAAPT